MVPMTVRRVPPLGSKGVGNHQPTLRGRQWGDSSGTLVDWFLPVDAPLGVDAQDGRVLGVVVLHLRVGELGTVDVDDNGGAARVLPRGCQAADLSRVSPGRPRRMVRGH